MSASDTKQPLGQRVARRFAIVVLASLLLACGQSKDDASVEMAILGLPQGLGQSGKKGTEEPPRKYPEILSRIALVPDNLKKNHRMFLDDNPHLVLKFEDWYVPGLGNAFGSFLAIREAKFWYDKRNLTWVDSLDQYPDLGPYRAAAVPAECGFTKFVKHEGLSELEEFPSTILMSTDHGEIVFVGDADYLDCSTLFTGVCAGVVVTNGHVLKVSGIPRGAICDWPKARDYYIAKLTEWNVWGANAGAATPPAR